MRAFFCFRACKFKFELYTNGDFLLIWNFKYMETNEAVIGLIESAAIAALKAGNSTKLEANNGNVIHMFHEHCFNESQKHSPKRISLHALKAGRQNNKGIPLAQIEIGENNFTVSNSNLMQKHYQNRTFEVHSVPGTSIVYRNTGVAGDVNIQIVAVGLFR